MTLEEAIIHAEEVVDRCEVTDGDRACAEAHRQLAEWLRELQETRKERDYWQEKAHSYEQTIFKLTDAISKQTEIIFCKDCKHKGTKNCVANAWTTIFGFGVKDDFFCGLGKRRTE